MESKFLDKMAKPFSEKMPTADSLDTYLDKLLKEARAHSEDLREAKFYVARPWVEVRDDETFHDTILHYFNPNNEYIKTTNGNSKTGVWRIIEGSNKLMIYEKKDGDAEMFELAFLDDQFFILTKHGDQKRIGGRKYFMMLFEPVAKKYVWREAIELLYTKYQSSNSFYFIIAIIFILLILIVYFLI